MEGSAFKQEFSNGQSRLEVELWVISVLSQVFTQVLHAINSVCLILYPFKNVTIDLNHFSCYIASLYIILVDI